MDFVIYVMKEGEWEFFIGDYFGEFINELDEGDWIIEFVCNGFKNYVYQIYKGKYVCKVKGFFFNYNNVEILNLDSMRDVMFNCSDL